MTFINDLSPHVISVPEIWTLAVKILNKQSWTADRGGPPAWWLDEGLMTPHNNKKAPSYKMLHKVSNLARSC